MNFLFGKSRLKKAIERGISTGDLDKELGELGDITLKSRADAEAVCWGMEQFSGENTIKLAQQVETLAKLFQEVPDAQCAAFGVLRERGIQELLRLYDEIQGATEGRGTTTLLFILKMLARFGTTEGTLKVVEAARLPLKPDDYMWSVILRHFTCRHPEAQLLYGSLSNSLPPDFIGVSLLDAANTFLIKGGEMVHPFDTSEGKQRLKEWLTNADAGEYSYARSAGAALPFISNPERDELLSLAMNHPYANVQMEAAWAAAKVGRKDGLDKLVDSCRDFRRAQTAGRYLQEIGHEDAIPAEAKDPSFVAKAEFSEWLAHPNELGQAPDELEIVDHRELPWPPQRALKPFWLIKYRAQDTTGLEEDNVGFGLVGSMTFCFFSYKLSQRPPEDAYAVHCYWEMEHAGLIEETDIKEDPTDYQSLLSQWRGGLLENAKVLYVAELSPELHQPQRMVGLASARLADCDGWVVLDGVRSEWYPKSEMPQDSYESVVLKVHIGRYLLGFTSKPERKRYLAVPLAPKPADELIAAYQKLLEDALKKVGKAKKEAFRRFSPISKHFEEYAAALKQAAREKEIAVAIDLLAPLWDHNTGYGMLGKAAFKCGEHELAEKFFLKLRNSYEDSCRSEELGLLAQIWFTNGRQKDAKDLLVDCLKKLVAGSRTATGSDKPLFESWFQNHRKTLLKLFPSEGPALLALSGIPDSTLG